MAKKFTKLNIGDTVATSGTRCFKKMTTEDPVLPMPTEPGLYDASNNLVASWDTLVNTYGMDVEKNYTIDNYNTDTASPYYVLSNSELSTGKTLVISNVDVIGKFAFVYSKLTNIIILDGVTSIEPYAFTYAESINVVIPDSVVSIGKCAFSTCTYLTSIEIPNGVKSIADKTFEECIRLKSVTIPASVTSIGAGAFRECYPLDSIEIPASVTSIGAGAFNGCGLRSFVIPDGVTSIEASTFRHCRVMTEVIIPASVNNIGNYAFDCCDSLADVYYKGTEEQWAAITIGSLNYLLTNATIHYNYTG